MKINWGTGIVIGMALFMAFIITLGVKMSRSKIDLVTKDYYEQGIEHEKHIEDIKAADALSSNVQVTVNYATKQLEVIFPPDFSGKTITGTLVLFNPGDARKDIQVSLAPNGLIQTIALDKLGKGNWRAKLQWQCGGEDYYFEKEISI